MKEYACYKNDEFICIGTLKEIAKYLGITYGSLLSYRANPKKSYYIFVELDKE